MTEKAHLRVLSHPARKNRHLNPYQHLLSSSLEAERCSVEEFTWFRAFMGGYDILLWHWPEAGLGQFRLRPIIRALAVLAASAMARIRGKAVAWVVHNTQPHDSHFRFAHKPFYATFARLVGGLVFLNSESRSDLVSIEPRYARIPSATIPHGLYSTAYPMTVSRSCARKHYGIAPNTVVFTLFGDLRPYKGVSEAITAFRKIDRTDVALVVAGKPTDRAYEAAMRQAAGDDDRIHLRLRRHSDDEVQYPLVAASAVLLPYKLLGNSGVALLALTFSRPVVAPRTGAIADLEREVGVNAIYAYDGEFSEGVLLAAVETLNLGTSESKDFDVAGLEWPSIGKRMRRFFDGIACVGPQQ